MAAAPGSDASPAEHVMSARTLLVDDSQLALQQLARAVVADPGFKVVGTAMHGLQAVDLAIALRPDLITLDVRMPLMDGLTALRHIMARRPVATVIVSSFAREDSHLTFDCMRCGAVDFILKPNAHESSNPAQDEWRSLVLDRLRQAVDVDAPAPWRCRLTQALSPAAAWDDRGPQMVVLVSAGRGGLIPLLEILHCIPVGLGVTVIASVAAEAQVVRAFGSYASRFTSLRVLSPRTDTFLRPEVALLVSTGACATLEQSQGRPCLHIEAASPPDSGAGLASSALELFADAVVGVLLSGGDENAARWAGDLETAGAVCVAQDAATALDKTLVTAAHRLASPLTVRPRHLDRDLFHHLMARAR